MLMVTLYYDQHGSEARPYHVTMTAWKRGYCKKVGGHSGQGGHYHLQGHFPIHHLKEARKGFSLLYCL